jgi:hypothetical protein
MNSLRSSSIAFLLALALSLSASAGCWAQATKTQAISLYNLGLNAFKQGSPESAIIFFKRAADIDPDLADAQYNLGVLYQSEKRLKEAVPRYLEVLRIKPGDADAHYQLGLAYMDLGRLQEARDQFSTIAPNSAHFVESQKRLAQLGQSAQAEQLTQPVQPVQPDAQSAQAVPPSIGMPPPSTPTLPNYTPPPPTPPPSAQSNPVAILPDSTVQIIAKGFSAPSGLAFDKHGNLYVANFLSNTIDRLAIDGTRSQFSMGVNLKGPIGLAVDDSGNVYVANYIGGFISRINPAGISSVIAKGFIKPYYLTLDSEGTLFVSQQEDNSVARITLPKPAVTRAQLPK